MFEFLFLFVFFGFNFKNNYNKGLKEFILENIRDKI